MNTSNVFVDHLGCNDELADRVPIWDKTALTGVGLYIRQVSNVIVRNLKIAKVDADNGDAVGIDESTNIWIDHLDLSGDLNAGKDDLDGLLDITHAADYVTVSNTYFHDHVSSPSRISRVAVCRPHMTSHICMPVCRPDQT